MEDKRGQRNLVKADRPAERRGLQACRKGTFRILVLAIVYGAAAAGTILYTVLDKALHTGSILSFPYGMIGRGLRALSLGSGAGNAAAWVLYAVIALLPAGIWGFLVRKKRNRKGDLFLPVFSIALFGILYAAVNPVCLMTITGASPQLYTGDSLLMALSVSVNSILLIYLVLRFFTWLAQDREGIRLFPVLRGFVSVWGLFQVIRICSGGIQTFRTAWEKYGPQAAAADIGFTYGAVRTSQGLLAVQTLVAFLPDILILCLLMLFLRLLQEMEADAYSEGTVKASEALAKWSKRLLLGLLAVMAAVNAAQMLLLSSQSNISIHSSMELFFVGFSCCLHLVAIQIRRASELKQYNDLFI